VDDITYNADMRSGRTIFSAVALILLPALPTLAAAAAASAPASNANVAVAVVRVQGQIDDHVRDYFIRHFNQAKAAGARTVILDLDTYGGLVTAGLDISRFIKSQSDVHTIAYVGDKAISAGALIALACNEIVIAPSAQLGDCAPIQIREDGSMETMGQAERQKAVSPILSEFKDSATRNGYDPLLVSSMVTADVTVHWIQNAEGQRRFVEPAVMTELAKSGWTEVHDDGVPAPVDSGGSLLTVSGTLAHKLGLAKSVHPTLDALTAARNYSVIATYAPSAGDKAIAWLNHPFVRMLLMLVFAQCLYAALHAPGHGFAEVLAILALTILVGVPLLTGYAQWWEIALIVVGVALLALELFVIPGFGVTGILGLLMILVGLVLTFVGSEPAGPGVLPTLDGTWTNLRNGMAMVAIALIASIFVSMAFRKYLPNMPYFNRLILTTTSGNIHEGGERSEMHLADYRPVPGAIGEALSELKPGGSATFFDPVSGEPRVFSVISDVGYIPRGTRIAVRTNADNHVVVRPIVST
jgi:membrane-bound serine protease (ClpP class)